MAWKGITNDRTDVGDGQLTIENSSYYSDGELLRRTGLGARIAQGGISVAEQGAYLLYVTSGGAIVSNDGTTPSTLLSGYNVVYRPCLQQSQGRMYFVNDFDAMRVSDDGVTIRTAGITAPSAAPAAPSTSAGNVDIGSHYLRYRWYDSRRMRYSDPSDAITVVVTSTTKTLTATKVTTADTTIDTIVWEMSPAANGYYYQAATDTNTAGTTAISISDANLVNRTSSLVYGDFGHVPPPLASILCEHQTYQFLWGSTPRTFTSCTITNGSPTITGTGFSTQWAGRKVTITGYTATYYVSTATTTTITLTANFVGTTSAAATISVVSGNPQLLCWSQPGQPESFDTTRLARNISMSSGDSPAAMLSLHGDLYLIGQRSMRRLNFTDDPATGQLVPVPSTLGAYHQRCVVTDAGNRAFGWGREGIWMIESMLPQKISDAIIDSVNALIDTTRTEERFVVWEPVERQVLFFFCLSGETACKAAAVYDVDSGNWQIWKYRQPMVCGCQNATYTDTGRLLLVDSNDSSWRVGVFQNDGSATGSILAGVGSTTTVIASNTANVGVVCYRPATAEEKYVLSATPTTFTLASAFATAPTAGEALYLGSIRQRILSEWFVADGINMEKRPRYLRIAFRPRTSAMGTLKVYLYKDFSTTAVGVTSSQSDVWPAGVTPISGSNYCLVDLDNTTVVAAGFVSIPVFSNWTRSIAWEVIAETPLARLRWLDINWSVNGKPEQSGSEGE